MDTTGQPKSPERRERSLCDLYILTFYLKAKRDFLLINIKGTSVTYFQATENDVPSLK